MTPYQSYLFCRNRHADVPLILVIEGDRLRAYDQDAIRLAAAMKRQPVAVNRHKLLDIGLNELIGLRRKFSPIMII